MRALNPAQLPQLAGEIRDEIKTVTKTTGGHIGSGLGVVELTIALHYSFDFLEDNHLILDVGHQCYPHKILTGRRERMLTLRQKDGLSGFPDPKESPYDRVKTGHGGTSLSTAIGMAVGLLHDEPETARRVVAMIGDGGLQEGMALEALNHGGSFEKLPLLIVLNDNQSGIGPTVGALANYFSKVRTGKIYSNARDNVHRMIHELESQTPPLGRMMRDFLDHVRAGMKGLMPLVRPGVIFEQLGYFYYGPIDGHDIPTLLDALKNCRKLQRPVVLHCITHKGKGFSDKEDFYRYHAGKPAKHITAHIPKEFRHEGGPPYTDIFVDESIRMAADNPKIIAITAAMLQGTGLEKFKERFPERCFDVGMAEQHGVGMAQGLALSGQIPICAIYSTFLQRSLDQLFQEVSLIDTPIVFCLDRAGVVGPDGATHNGVFDIAYCRMLPNFVVMAPRDGTELRAMMRLAARCGHPAAIRYPRANTPTHELERPARAFEVGESELIEDGPDGCLIAYGSMVYPALDAAHAIFEHHGKRLAVVNGRFAKPLDERMLRREFGRQPVIFTLEDHMKAGGFGSAVLEHACQQGFDTRKLENIAIEDHYIDHAQRAEALAEAGLDVPGIVRRIEGRMNLPTPHSELRAPDYSPLS